MEHETQEQCARLVENMARQSPWSENPMARAALMIAARAIRRGRLLTPEEKLENLKRALSLP